MNKKGDKELQMIFGLFILLIISLVVLSLFFNFMNKTKEGLKNIAEKSVNAIQDGIDYCNLKCSEADTEAAAIEYCKTVVAIEAGSSVDKHEIFSYGQNIYCEDEIPCFLLTRCPQSTGKYDAQECRRLLFTYRRAYFVNMSYPDATGDCNLPTSGIDAPNNWVSNYCFNQNYDPDSDSFTDTNIKYEALPVCPEPFTS